MVTIISADSCLGIDRNHSFEDFWMICLGILIALLDSCVARVNYIG
jgi:hypothetical protein